MELLLPINYPTIRTKGKRTMTENTTFKVAVYGTLLKGECNERWADGALERVPCTIMGTIYNLGYFPAFVPDGRQAVEAELLTVTAEGLAHMDILEGYPRYYRRDEIEATLADGTVVAAMVYVMNSLPPRARLIPNGSWRKRNDK